MPLADVLRRSGAKPTRVVTFDLYGAAGADGNFATTIRGAGGRVQGTAEIEAGTELWVYVGQSNQSFSTGTRRNPGWNGGGAGGSGGGSSSSCGGGGGGATDVRVGGQALADRIATAGGGGGGGGQHSSYNYDADGGNAGGLTGQDAQGGSYQGHGGTQSAGGSAGTGAQAGTLGQGGNGEDQASTAPDGGGGGGGYYGGGGGGAISSQAGGGGGGSSHHALLTGGSTTPGVRDGHGTATLTIDGVAYTYNYTGSPQLLVVP